MINRKAITLGFALVISSALTRPCLASTYIFSYSFLGGVNSITASGALTVGAQDPATGGFPILSIVGTRDVNGVNMQITGILPTTGLNSFDGNDNLLFYPNPPFLDFNGVSFSVDNLSLSDDGLGDVNVYFDFGSGMYTEAAAGVNPGSFSVSPQASGSSIPEPSTMILLVGGLFGLAVVGSRRSWRTLQKPNEYCNVISASSC